MSPADGIRKLGFRRWYERQLIESHAYLVTGFLSMILFMACIEDAGPRGKGPDQLLMLAVVVSAGIVCWIAMGRYKAVLDRAENLAGQSVCGQCGVYGLLQVMGSRWHSSNPDQDPADGGELLTVQCRKCGYQWTMGADGT